MQIEFYPELSIIFVYIDVRTVQAKHVESLIQSLEAETGLKVVIVPNGQPIKRAGKPLFYICKDDEVTISIVKKFTDAKPGAIIPLNEEEWDVYHKNFEAIPPYQ